MIRKVRPKKSYFSSAWEYVKTPFSLLKVPKKAFNSSSYKYIYVICRYLCIKAQKVHLFRPSLGFLVEAQPRLENRRGQKALFGRGVHNVFRLHLGKTFEKHESIVN
jgi:hypothetical protein